MNSNKLIALLASSVMLLAVLAGLILLGAPSEERLQRLDQHRLADLQVLTDTVEGYARRNGYLPTRLESLVDGQLLDVMPVDPETGVAYDYAITGERNYRLCATFSTASRDSTPQGFWTHPAGRACFEFDTQIQ